MIRQRFLHTLVRPSARSLISRIPSHTKLEPTPAPSRSMPTPIRFTLRTTESRSAKYPPLIHFSPVAPQPYFIPQYPLRNPVHFLPISPPGLAVMRPSGSSASTRPAHPPSSARGRGKNSDKLGRKWAQCKPLATTGISFHVCPCHSWCFALRTKLYGDDSDRAERCFIQYFSPGEFQHFPASSSCLLTYTPVYYHISMLRRRSLFIYTYIYLSSNSEACSFVYFLNVIPSFICGKNVGYK